MLKITEIRIENQKERCITDNLNPRISFSLVSDKQETQLVKAKIAIGDWIVQTSEQTGIVYNGKPLKSFTIYKVEITAEDNYGETATSYAEIETARLDAPWEAKWISDLSYMPEERQSPKPMTFKKTFRLKKQIKRAVVYSSALGIYELEINGKKIGSDYFAPGLTSYANQIQYQIYDATGILSTNENIIFAVVGGGWAVGRFTYAKGGKTQISADRQAFLMELRLEYVDGSLETICTDTDWNVTEEGNYKFADFYDGEIYDATVDIEKAAWKKASVTTPRGTPKLIAQYGAPVRSHEIFEPIKIFESKSGEIIYDFGQNFAGVIHAEIDGKKGQTITFRHAEVLSDGELFVKSLRTAKATTEYTCGDGHQVYSPRMTYMGFRYVGVKGIAIDKLKLSAVALYSDIEEIGSFECSNELLNKLQSNIRWGGKSNFVDIPTDCPQRDERQGWTGDISVFAQTACFNFDMSRFLDKWLLDLKAEQGKGGGIPMVVPRQGDSWPTMANSCWGDSCVLVPWAEYLSRGDLELLRRQYGTMKRFLKAAKWWAGFLSIGKTHRRIWRFPFHFGDWCAPGENVMSWMKKGKWVATAYWANSCLIVSKIAELLGEKQDAEYYCKLRSEICSAYRKVFTDKKGNLKKEFQTAYVLPLYFNMVEGEERKTMAKNLARLVREADYHLTTGFTGTPYLLFALADNGYIDEAFRLLNQDTCPSWLYEVKAGGTTIWERWDALREDGTVNTGSLTSGKEAENGGMVSFNHYANGAVGDFLYRRIAGIEPTSGGYKTFKINPIVGNGLTYAKGSVKTPYGEIVSNWKLEESKFILMVQVPVSTECSLLLPNGKSHILTSGKYTFQESLPKNQ